MSRRVSAYLSLSLGLGACGPAQPAPPDALQLGSTVQETAIPQLCNWRQFGGSSRKTGLACPEITGLRIAARVVQDNNPVPQDFFWGFYKVHQPPALTDGNMVYVPHKHGFTSYADQGTQQWGIEGLEWVPSVWDPDAVLVSRWKRTTEWRPVDTMKFLGTPTGGYEQLLGPAVANGSLYMPAAHGGLIRLDGSTGAELATIQPLAGTAYADDSATIVATSITADESTGNLFYEVVAWPPSFNQSVEPRDSWLIEVHPDNSTRVIPWTQIASAVVGVPGARGKCEYRFGTGGTPAARPFPPTLDAVPPRFDCGVQRPKVNTAPTLVGDGTMIVLSEANNSQEDNYLIAVDIATMQPLRSVSTNRRFPIGCGVLTPYGTGRFDCRQGATIGVNPNYNAPYGFQGSDLVESHITVAPNGDIGLCGYIDGSIDGGGTDARGGCVVFDKDLNYRAINPSFGWQVTLAVWKRADGTWSYLQNLNKFSDNDNAVAQYSPDFALEKLWRKAPIGGDPDHFVDGQVSFDHSGNVYSLDERGIVYKFAQDGSLLESLDLRGTELEQVLSTETVSDVAGRRYFGYAGELILVGGGGPPASAPRSVVRHSTSRGVQVPARGDEASEPAPPVAR